MSDSLNPVRKSISDPSPQSSVRYHIESEHNGIEVGQGLAAFFAYVQEIFDLTRCWLPNDITSVFHSISGLKKSYHQVKFNSSRILSCSHLPGSCDKIGLIMEILKLIEKSMGHRSPLLVYCKVDLIPSLA